MKLKDVASENLVRIPNSTVVFVKGVNHRESRELEGRTIHPAAMHKLFLEQTNIVRPLLYNYGAYFAVVFASEKPMEQYIKNGNLYVSATYDNEARELKSSVDSLIKAGIDKKSFEKGGKVLYIFDCYSVDDSKNNEVAFAVSDGYKDSAAISDWLKGDGWREEDGGLASTRRVDSPILKDVYNDEYVSKEGIILGPVRRGDYYFDDDQRNVSVGGGLVNRRGVFKESAGTSLDEGNATAKARARSPP